MSNEWIRTHETPPPEGRLVFTKIDDDQGERNVQALVRRKNLYWTADGRMYVYYTPTHWKP